MSGTYLVSGHATRSISYLSCAFLLRNSFPLISIGRTPTTTLYYYSTEEWTVIFPIFIKPFVKIPIEASRTFRMFSYLWTTCCILTSKSSSKLGCISIIFIIYNLTLYPKNVSAIRGHLIPFLLDISTRSFQKWFKDAVLFPFTSVLATLIRKKCTSLFPNYYCILKYKSFPKIIPGHEFGAWKFISKIITTGSPSLKGTI